MKKLFALTAIFAFGLLLTTSNIISAGEKKNEKVVKIKGMTCTACESKVKEALLKVDGVKSAEVSYKTGEAKVVLASDKVDLKKINTAVMKSGFQPISYDGKSACEAGACDCCSAKKPTEAKKSDKKK